MARSKLESFGMIYVIIFSLTWDSKGVGLHPVFIYIYLCIHIDDGLLCTNNIKSLEEFKKTFTLKVDKITIVQPLIKYVGIQTKYDRNNGCI